jgi:hypothetical protein
MEAGELSCVHLTERAGKGRQSISTIIAAR